MFLDLTDVLRGPGQTLEKQLKIAPTTLDDIEIVEPVEGTLRVENARRNLVVRGRAHTAIKMLCSRCLEPSAQPLDLEFEANAPLRLFGPAGFGALHDQHAHHNHHHGEVEDDEDGEPDDELAALFEGHTLDVLELVRQAIELQAPIQPLCSPECPGLPEASKYSVAEAASRWGALENWKAEHGKNGSAHDVQP
jgi:uncharacterized protein